MRVAFLLVCCAVACLTAAGAWGFGPAGLAAAGAVWGLLAVAVPWDRLDDDERRG